MARPVLGPAPARRARDGRFGERSLDGSAVYAEKNWGAAFADHWWWGQATGRGLRGRPHPRRRADGGGGVDAARLVTLAPPFARTVARAGGGEWHIRARSPRWRVELEGEAGDALRLPVPLPAQRRLEVRSSHHLSGR